ncbi:hypothetical protein BGW41_000690 [Actinomortierella wolfii]|nr:hypothetical protein BGW41_000690 [Actinomortierella wolfii]
MARSSSFVATVLAILVCLQVAAAQIASGVYRITSVKENSTVRQYVPGAPLFVPSYDSVEAASGTDIWKVNATSGGYTFQNMASSLYAHSTPTFVTVNQQSTKYRIKPAGDGAFEITSTDGHKVWSVVIGDVKNNVYLQARNGSPAQKFRFRRL